VSFYFPFLYCINMTIFHLVVFKVTQITDLMVQLICTVVHTVYGWMPSGPGNILMFVLFVLCRINCSLKISCSIREWLGLSGMKEPHSFSSTLQIHWKKFSQHFWFFMLLLTVIELLCTSTACNLQCQFGFTFTCSVKVLRKSL